MVVTSGSNKQVTQSTEDYLKAVFSLSEGVRSARRARVIWLKRSALARPRSRKCSSIWKLFVAHTPYHGVLNEKDDESRSKRSVAIACWNFSGATPRLRARIRA
jgi:hypothetical protein